MSKWILILAVLSAVLICGSYGQAQYPPPPEPTKFTTPYFGLKGHKFFIPNPYAQKGAGMNDNILVRNQKRAKAMALFFRNLFLGNPALSNRLEFSFNPKEARERWRPEYIRKFGNRGERLVEFLGSGPTKDQIVWSLGTVY